MKLRFGTPSIDDEEEGRLEEEVRRLTADQPRCGSLPDSYWANLLVRSNQRIDEATSPRALTISWAARVAFPGVLALLSFLVGVRYFVPMKEDAAAPLKAVILSLSDKAVDTLLADPYRISQNLSLADLGVDPFPLEKEDLAEYLIAAGNVSFVTESLSDDEVTDVLTILGSKGSEPNSGAK
jgi:hypothetical protein